MRVLSQKFLCSSCTYCHNCYHGFHSSSALKLEDAQQVSPCQCQVPEIVKENTLNGNAKDKGLYKVKLANEAEGNRLDDVKEKENTIYSGPQSAQEKFGSELAVDNSNGNLEEDRRTLFPIDVLQVEVENLDACAAENRVSGNLEEDRRTLFPIDVLQVEAKNMDGCAAENQVSEYREIDKGSSRSSKVPKSILKKPSFPEASSSLGLSSANKRVKWMPDEQLVDVQEIENGFVYEEDETRRCVCIIL